jgi:hypothetical protein
MASQAFQTYLGAQEMARVLRGTAQDRRLRPMTLRVKQKYYHAALAAYVAGWDYYIKSCVREFYTCTSDPFDARYFTVHTRSIDLTEKFLRNLNTPDRDRAREAILLCTGYDPIGDWTWPRAAMSATQVKDFLDEIFKVRHSFAHGFELPGFSWTTTATGKRQLADAALGRVEAFLAHLVKKTDSGLRLHAATFFRGPPIW